MTPTFKAALGAVLFVAAPLSALAQQGPMGESGLIARVAALEAVMRGAIIASPEACETLGAGWAPYTAAEGRFLLGTGEFKDGNKTWDYKPGDTGGGPVVTLREKHLPKHEHIIRWGGHDFVSLETDPQDENPQRKEHFLRSGGDSKPNLGKAHDKLLAMGSNDGDQPHENMPPYIAIHFCTFGR